MLGTTRSRSNSSPPQPQLTDRCFAAALANELHGGHRRLGTQIPYAAHLMIVAGLVLEDGGDETQAIAALLHTPSRTAAAARCSSVSAP